MAFQLDGSYIRPGRMTRPFGNVAIVASRSEVAGIVPVDPAAIIWPEGGAMVHASARVSSSRLRRAATSIPPSSARIAVQCSVTIFRKLRTFCQCSAYLSGTKSRSPLKDRRSVCTWPRNRSNSAANRVAWSTVMGPAGDSQFRIRRASISRRRSPGITGGNSRSAPVGKSCSSSSSSSTSPRGRIVGSNKALPLLARKKASRSARQARRVGNKIVYSRRDCGVSPTSARTPFAKLSTKDWSGGIV